jgi:hypothetical protein
VQSYLNVSVLVDELHTAVKTLHETSDAALGRVPDAVVF